MSSGAEHEIDLIGRAIWQHLRMLEDAGLVNSRRAGRYEFRSIDRTPLLTAVSRWVDEETPR